MSDYYDNLHKEATNPETTPERLRELSRFRGYIGRLVAQNPNAPTDVLLYVARWCWESVLRNPVLPLLLLENPGLPAEFPVVALRQILKLENPPREFLPPLMRHSNAEIREGVRLHRANGAVADKATLPELPLTGSAALAELLASGLAPHWIVEAALECAVGSLRGYARTALRALPDAEPLRERVLWMREAGADPSLQCVGKGKADMAPEKLVALAQGGPFARKLAARHPNTPPESLIELAELHQADIVRRCVAENSSTPPQTLISLASTGHAALRKAVAKNKQCPSGLLEQLSADASAAVREAVAVNSACPIQALARLASDAHKDVRFSVARNRAADEATLRLLAKDADEDVRSKIARRRDCPRDVLLTLSKDVEWHVRHSTTVNPAIKVDRYVRFDRVLSERDDENDECPAIDAPLTPKEARREWLSKQFHQEPVPDEVIAEAATFNDSHIRANVAQSASASVELLRQLLRDNDSYVRHCAAGNEKLPLAERLALLDTEAPNIRVAVILAGDIPDEIFERLSRDPSDEVRAAVAGIKRTPGYVLIQMAKEELSLDVAKRMCHGFDNHFVPDEAFLTLLERFPSIAHDMANHNRLTRPVLEALIPLLGWYPRISFIYHGNFERARGKEVLAFPPDLQIKAWEFPEKEWYYSRLIRQQVVNYWAVTPEVLEAAARAELALAAKSDYHRARQNAASGILGSIAAHSLTPPALLAELTQHPSAKVRLAALENLNTPAEAKTARRAKMLKDAATSQGVTVRLCALSNPETAQDILRKAAFQGRWMERLAVARNAGAPRQILAYLSEDSNVAVAAAARETLQLKTQNDAH